MNLKRLTLILMTAVVLSGVLVSAHPAASQDIPDWYLGYNFNTGRVVAFGVENGAAQIGMEWRLEAGQSIEQVWRLGPQTFLFRLQVENSEAHPTWLMTAKSRREITALIDWDTFPNGWAEPIFYAQNSLVLFDLGYGLEPTLLVVDLDQAEVKRFAPVDTAGGPRLGADGTTLRFVTRSNNLPDEWRLNELNLAIGDLQVSNVIQVASSELPAITSDRTGDHWLVRPPLVSTPRLVNVNGQVETVTSPLVGVDIQTGLLNDYLYQVDMACPANCVLYARPIAAATWNIYTLPEALPMTSVHLRDFVNGDLFFLTDPAGAGLIRPNATAEMIGYGTVRVSNVQSPDHQLVVLADSATDPTQNFVYSFERHERLFAWDAEVSGIIQYGPTSIAVHGSTDLLYRLSDGQLIELPTPPNEQLELGGRAVLADGSLLFGAREGEGDAKIRYIFHFNPLKDDAPREILQAVELWPLREVMTWWVASCGMNPGC